MYSLNSVYLSVEEVPLAAVVVVVVVHLAPLALAVALLVAVKRKRFGNERKKSKCKLGKFLFQIHFIFAVNICLNTSDEIS